MLHRGNSISDAAAVLRSGLCKLNVVLIWSVGSHGALDSPKFAATATVASPSASACLCPQQRKLKKGPVAAPEPARYGCTELDSVSAGPLQQGRM